MKRTDSTEMDRLLRRHFRRNNETLRNGSDANAQESNSAAHLDADEMNAYAEGDLPEAARSRYFAHLADCDSCRKLVTELTLASGAASEEKRAAVAEATPSKSWREWLASLLSTPVLRYGVPALALLSVIIVAIVALRARREQPYMAQNKEATRNSALQTSSSSNSEAGASTTTTAENHANANASSSNTAPAITQQSQTEISPAATPAPAKATMEGNAPVTSPSIAAKPEAQSGSIRDKKQERELGEEAKTDRVVGGTTTTPATQPAPPAPTPAPTDADDMARREEQKKPKAVAKEADETVIVTNSAGAATTQTTTSELPRDKRAASRSAQNMRPSTAASKPSGAASEKDSSSETRTVGGHRFRRQGSVWVDTAYNSSRPAINIARGSEQYRALLADEPGLRAIAQQLGGEVIVVWGNKAYRFY